MAKDEEGVWMLMIWGEDMVCVVTSHQEIVETLVFPVRSDHVMDP